MSYQPPDLSLLREIVGSQNAPIEVRGDPKDAVGEGAITLSELWLEENKHLTPVAKYSRWKTEVRAGARVTPNNKDYMWETEAKLHPKGAKFATEDKLNIIRERLTGLDDTQKENYLQDIAREAPPPILNALLLDKTILSSRSASKTQERSRLANIHSFDKKARELGQQIFAGNSSGLNPEVSINSHAEDFVKAWSFNRDDVFVDGDGRIAVTSEEGEIVPVWSLEDSALTWEEQAINYHDLTPVAKRGLKPMLNYSRQNARLIDRTATLELGKSVEMQPREFQSSIIVDAALLAEDPMNYTKEAVYKTVNASIERGEKRSLRDVTRDFTSRWEDIRKTTADRAGGN